MKKYLSLLIILLLGVFALPEAANQNRGGTVKYHNFLSYASWDYDSVKVGPNDTLFLYDDSASSVPFSSAAIGRNKTSTAGVYDRAPDSLGFLLQTFGEGDAVSFEFNVQYSLNGKSGPWVTYGTPDTVTVANTSKQINHPGSRKFLMDAMVRATIKTTTATDTTRVSKVRFLPLFR